ncbi:MAG: hypothetical protein P8P30_05715 [Rickettsiales bacterium]|nr:hypothetical protein [Rickettsiales bacterium]
MPELAFHPLLKNTVAHAVQGEWLICSSKNRLFRLSMQDFKTQEPLGDVPWGIKQLPCHIRLVDRILKYGILHACPIDESRYLVANDHGWWLLDQGRASKVSMPSDTRPMMRSTCIGASGRVYYGEYFGNAQRRAVEVLGSREDSLSFAPVHAFAAGEVRHIHALLNDPYMPQRIWIPCGDEDEECTIYYTDDEFETVHKFCNFGQKSRAVDMIILEDKLIWGMDSPLETSYILQVDKHNPTEPEIIYELPGPAYYMTRNEAGGVYLGTTAEPGPAVKDNLAHLIALRPDGSWQDVYQATNDKVPQFGIFHLPKGVLPGNKMILSSRAVTKHEGQLLLAEDTEWK